MHKSTSPASRKSARRIAHSHPTPAPAKPARAVKPGREPVPVVTRLDSDVELVAPAGCYASVVLKLVDRDDDHRYYSWWTVVGRHDMDKISVPYKYTGEDTIRFDLPEGVPLSAKSLQPHLATFLAAERTKPGGPPVIRD